MTMTAERIAELREKMRTRWPEHGTFAELESLLAESEALAGAVEGVVETSCGGEYVIVSGCDFKSGDRVLVVKVTK